MSRDLQAKWTPGPWTVAGPRSQKRGGFPRVVTGEGGWDIAEVTGETLSEAKANAHLLAAATDLYDGLRDALFALDLAAASLADEQKRTLTPFVLRARRALARARGEEG